MHLPRTGRVVVLASESYSYTSVPSVLPAGSIATTRYAASRKDETNCSLALFGILPTQSCALGSLLSQYPVSSGVSETLRSITLRRLMCSHISARLAIGTRPDVPGRGALRPRPKAEVAEPDQEQHRPQVREQVDGQVARGPARRDDEAPHQDPKRRGGQQVPHPPRPRRPPHERDREEHGSQEPGEQPEGEGHDEPQGSGRRRGDEPGRLVGQPRQHERTIEAQEQAEKHPRHLYQREPDQSGQPALSGHPGVDGGQPQEYQRGAQGAKRVGRHPKARLRRDGRVHARGEHGSQDDVQDERDGADEDQEAADLGEPRASHPPNLSPALRTARPCPGRGYEPPGLGAPRGRTTSSLSSLCPPSLRATDETTRTCTFVS